MQIQFSLCQRCFHCPRIEARTCRQTYGVVDEAAVKMIDFGHGASPQPSGHHACFCPMQGADGTFRTAHKLLLQLFSF